MSSRYRGLLSPNTSIEQLRSERMRTMRVHSLGLLLGASLIGAGALAGEPLIQVYKTPTCGCCTEWVSHLRENGFEVESMDLTDLRMVKSLA